MPIGHSTVVVCVALAVVIASARADAQPITLPDAALHIRLGEPEEAARALELAADAVLGSAASSTLDRLAAVGHLDEAVRVRLALADRPGAEHDANQAVVAASRESLLRSSAWAIVERVGAACEQAADQTRVSAAAPPSRDVWQHCRELYGAAATDLGRDVPLDVRVEEHVALARAERALGNAAEEFTHLRAAIEDWRRAMPDEGIQDVGLDNNDPFPPWGDRLVFERCLRPAPGARTYRLCLSAPRFSGSVGGDDPELAWSSTDLSESTESSRARGAIAEARFALAVHTLNFIPAAPVYQGPHDTRALDRWEMSVFDSWTMRSVFYEWVAYQQLSAASRMGIWPWHVLAAARTGEAHFQQWRVLIALAHQRTAIQLYPVWCDDRRSDRAHAAIAEFEYCARAAMRAAGIRQETIPNGTYGYDQLLNTCLSRLSELDPRMYPLSDEIVPALRR